MMSPIDRWMPLQNWLSMQTVTALFAGRTIPPRAPEPSRYAPLSDQQTYDLMRERAAAFGFAAFLKRCELDFDERLYFVEFDNRTFGVMAYSPEDARRQVSQAHFHLWGGIGG